MDDLANREFGDYHIIRRIGSGATADVFLAEQRSLGRHVALKILKKNLANNEIYLQRFVREAKAIAALNHPGLVQIFQTDCLDGYWFIAQEYIQGETLQQVIGRDGALPIPQVLNILWRIAAAFETASGSGIIHRDIKPDNILLGSRGIVKVTDFGLAHVKVSLEHSQLALTEAGMTLGTPLYMSPEQAQGQKLDHRSDIYSLGITCWHALTGKPPFMGGTALSVALQQVNALAPPLAKMRSGIPPALIAIVERMIEKKPEHRFQTFHCILLEMQAHGLVPESTDLAPRLSLANLSARRALQYAIQRQKTRFGKVISVILAVLFISFLGWSSGYAYRTWIAPPSFREAVLDVPKFATVEEQWIHACFLNTPDAWKAVIDYFPDEEWYWGYKAKRQLIRHYYFGDNPYDSLPLFQEFADLSAFEQEERMLGFAGLAWCLLSDSPDARDMQRAQDYLREIPLSYVLSADELFGQIFDAAAKLLRDRENGE
ncbi:MAG: serine/threonine protein kinase [Planctomycetaceae bacterium]|nr:serine/threonine protein kinase [Planctomycetaceae bacterium]